MIFIKKKKLQVPYLFYFIPEVLRYKQIGEKIITSEAFLNREKINLFFHTLNSVAPGEQ